MKKKKDEILIYVKKWEESTGTTFEIRKKYVIFRILTFLKENVQLYKITNMKEYSFVVPVESTSFVPITTLSKENGYFDISFFDNDDTEELKSKFSQEYKLNHYHQLYLKCYDGVCYVHGVEISDLGYYHELWKSKSITFPDEIKEIHLNGDLGLIQSKHQHNVADWPHWEVVFYFKNRKQVLVSINFQNPSETIS